MATLLQIPPAVRMPSLICRIPALLLLASCLAPLQTPSPPGNELLPLITAITGPSATTLSNLADTGQSLCYNGGGVIPCGDALWPGQDADSSNLPRARALTGPTAHPVYTTDYTVSDGVTGLVWKSCSEGLSDATCTTGSPISVDHATAVAQCAALNSAPGYAGRTDWRLPEYHEILSIVNFGTGAVDSPFLNTAFPSWANTTAVWNPINMWYLSSTGDVNVSPMASTYHALCVSGTVLPPAQFTDNGDFTVTDSRSKLVWQRCSQGQTEDATCSGVATAPDWQSALNYCNALTLAGRTWRLPSIAELHRLVDVTATNPSIATAFFPSTVANYYWSSTTDALSPSRAWAAYFFQGFSTQAIKTAVSTYHVRCVSGP